MDDTDPIRAAASPDLSPVVISLLKGVVYRDDDPSLWSALLDLQPRLRDHVAVMRLELSVDEAEGYAFLRSWPDAADDDGAPHLPRLVVRRPLSFPVSLLLALLRKKLAEFDAAGSGARLILSRDDVVEMIRVFLPAGSNEARLIDQVDAHVNRVAELGFVRRLRAQEQMIEVQRILKAFVDAQWLGAFDARLAAYRAQLKRGSGNEE